MDYLVGNCGTNGDLLLVMPGWWWHGASGGCMCKLWGHLTPQVLKKLVEIYCSIYDMTSQLLLASPTGFDGWIHHCTVHAMAATGEEDGGTVRDAPRGTTRYWGGRDGVRQGMAWRARHSERRVVAVGGWRSGRGRY
jgi:hypothetical protein